MGSVLEAGKQVFVKGSNRLLHLTLGLLFSQGLHFLSLQTGLVGSVIIAMGQMAFPLYHEAESVMQLKHPQCLWWPGAMWLVHVVFSEFKHIMRERAMMKKAQDCCLELSRG